MAALELIQWEPDTDLGYLVSDQISPNLHVLDLDGVVEVLELPSTLAVQVEQSLSVSDGSRLAVHILSVTLLLLIGPEKFSVVHSLVSPHGTGGG
jgi:hypothetical protein